MSTLQSILPLVMQFAKQSTSKLQRPSRLPEIASMILSNKREREKIKQAAIDTAVKENIANKQMQAEQAKTDAYRQGQLLDAFSRIVASGEDVPEDLAQAMQAGNPASISAGGFNLSGVLPSLNKTYVPPNENSNPLFTQIMNAKTPEELRALGEQYPKMGHRLQSVYAQRMNALESPSREPDVTLPDIDAVRKGEAPPSGAPVAKALSAANMQDVVSGKTKQEEIDARRQLAKESREESDKDTSLRQMQEGTKLKRPDMFLNAYKNLSPEDQQEFIQKGNGPIVQGHRDSFMDKEATMIENPDNQTLSNFNTFTQDAAAYDLHKTNPNKFYPTYEAGRKGVAQKELKGFGYKNISIENKDKALELVNKLSQFSEMEGRVNPSTIPTNIEIVPKRIIHSELSGFTDVPATLKISGTTRQVKPEEAQKFWESLKEKIRKEMGD